MSLTVPARDRRILACLALVFSIGLSARAQRVGAVRGWFSTPSCVSGAAPVPGIDVEDGAADRRDGSPALAERARTIVRSLPQGRAQELAQALARSLAPRRHLRYVCKDESETGYVIRYPEDLGTEFVSEAEFVEFGYEVPNLGRPEIEFSVVAVPRDGTFIYSYQVSNGIGATRSIRAWDFVSSPDDRSLRLEDPTNWNSGIPARGSGVVPQAALYEDLSGPELMQLDSRGKLSGWVGLGEAIDPGETAGSFMATSSFLPGWTTAYVRSKVDLEKFALPFSFGEFPEAVQEEIQFLNRRENRLSSLPIIGPRFGMDAGREAIARNWQIGIQTMISHGWLMDESPYVAELVQFLKDPSQVDVSASIRSEPMKGMESLLDKIIRMAF